MTGAVSDKACPADWQDLDELSLLAVVGQFSRIATRPQTPDGLQLRPEIPPLSLPTMAEALRPQFRRLLDNKLADAEDVVRLIAIRGYCVNPIDWMPKRPDTNLPSTYDPWVDWLDGNSTDYSENQLNADTWDHLPTHSRYRQLTMLHSADAEAARDLIASVAPTRAAEQRLRMLECLKHALSENDKPLLETFSSDRSSKVQTFVRIQLARLGHNTVSDDDASHEVADFLEVQRAGLLSRRKIVAARKLKNDAQRKRRRNILGRMSLKSLAKTLQLSTDDFIDMWAFGGATEEISDVIASSATDAEVNRFATRVVESDDNIAQSIMARLSSKQKTQLGLRILAKDDWTFSKSMAWFPSPDGSIPLSQIDLCIGLAELIMLAAQDDKTGREQTITTALNFLGLIADRDAATTLVERLLAAGIMAVDPRLTLLRLNAAL